MDDIYKPGQKLLIETVTKYYTGTVTHVTPEVIKMIGVAWVADTGRLTEALRDEVYNEVEMYQNEVNIHRTGIISSTTVKTPPTEQI